MGFIKDLADKVEKTIVCATWRNRQVEVLNFIREKILEKIQPFTVQDICKASKEKLSLLNISLEHDNKDMLEVQKYACYIPEAYDLITNTFIINLLCERKDLISGLNQKELGWLLEQIRDYKNFLWNKDVKS